MSRMFDDSRLLAKTEMTCFYDTGDGRLQFLM